MIRRTILLPAMTILLLLSSVAYAVPDTTGAHKDTIAIQVLEERIEQNAKNTQTQVECIQNEMRVRTDALEHRLDIYAGVALFLLGLLSWVGYKTVKGWAKDRVEKMAGEVFEEGLADFKKRTTELTDQLAEETRKAEIQRREFDLEAQKLFGKYRAREADRIRTGAAIDIRDLSDYVQRLSETKSKNQYTARDWFLSGYEAGERGDSEEALRCYSNSIKLDPNEYWSYHNRGAALIAQGLYDEALKDFDKVLEIDPEHISALLNAAEAGIMLGQYDDAQRRASKALAISEGSHLKACSLYLKCIAEKLLGKETSATEAEFDRILKEDFEVLWSFDEIEGWLKEANISDEAREFIRAKTAMLKAKKKKQ